MSPTKKKSELSGTTISLLVVILGGVFTMGNTLLDKLLVTPTVTETRVTSVVGHTPSQAFRNYSQVPKEALKSLQIPAEDVPSSAITVDTFTHRIDKFAATVGQLDLTFLIPLLVILMGVGHILFDYLGRFLPKRKEDD